MLPERSQDSQGGTTQGTDTLNTHYSCIGLLKTLFLKQKDVHTHSMLCVCPSQTLVVKVFGVICSVVGGLAVGKVNINWLTSPNADS